MTLSMLCPRRRITKVFDEQLFARIDAFQITRVELPVQFQNAILQSIEAKQNITSSERYKDNMEVTCHRVPGRRDRVPR